ncbi:unnamed protein product, partial [Amoebophrya sp. A25]|eukprot:GSA25T00023643001.1
MQGYTPDELDTLLKDSDSVKIYAVTSLTDICGTLLPNLADLLYHGNNDMGVLFYWLLDNTAAAENDRYVVAERMPFYTLQRALEEYLLTKALPESQHEDKSIKDHSLQWYCRDLRNCVATAMEDTFLFPQMDYALDISSSPHRMKTHVASGEGLLFFGPLVIEHDSGMHVNSLKAAAQGGTPTMDLDEEMRLDKNVAQARQLRYTEAAKFQKHVPDPLVALAEPVNACTSRGAVGYDGKHTRESAPWFTFLPKRTKHHIVRVLTEADFTAKITTFGGSPEFSRIRFPGKLLRFNVTSVPVGGAAAKEEHSSDTAPGETDASNAATAGDSETTSSNSTTAADDGTDASAASSASSLLASTGGAERGSGSFFSALYRSAPSSDKREVEKESSAEPKVVVFTSVLAGNDDAYHAVRFGYVGEDGFDIAIFADKLSGPSSSKGAALVNRGATSSGKQANQEEVGEGRGRQRFRMAYLALHTGGSMFDSVLGSYSA